MPVENGSETRPALSASIEPLPNLAVLRGRRTKNKNALQTDLDWLKQITAVTDENRLEVLSAKFRVEGRLEELRKVDGQMLGHPLLPAEDFDREVEESDAAVEVALSARAIIAALCTGTELEAPARSSGVAPLTANAVDPRGPIGTVETTSTVAAATGRDAVTARAQREPSAANSESPSVVVESTGPLSATAGVQPAGTVVGNVVSSVCANSKLFLDTTPEPFDGSVSLYRLWRAQFLNYVERRTEATGCDKLVVLCRLLKGSPKELISELPLTDRNYEVALKLLDDNYDVPELRQRDVLASVATVPSERRHRPTRAPERNSKNNPLIGSSECAVEEHRPPV